MERSHEGPLVQFREVTKTYRQRRSFFSRDSTDVKALDRVSFQITPGEIFSLVGESGSGKTTCGRLLVRLEEPNSGEIRFGGDEISSMKPKEMRSFRRRIQMIFQDPYQSLNPQLTVFQTVVEPLLVQRIGDHRYREEKVQELLEEVGLHPSQDFLFRYPHQLSGGQRQRVAVARAMVLSPEFVVADEPVSMLDASIQAQILNMLLDLKERYSLTLMFITHDLATARYLSDRIGVIYRGRILEYGPAESVIQNPLHPYTRALIHAVPTVQRRRDQLPPPACPVDLFVPPAQKGGCPFLPRCTDCSPRCQEQEAALEQVESEHYAACFLHYG
jgi:peptide/nickel transport system ATP-binding protein